MFVHTKEDTAWGTELCWALLFKIPTQIHHLPHSPPQLKTPSTITIVDGSMVSLAPCRVCSKENSSIGLGLHISGILSPKLLFHLSKILMTFFSHRPKITDFSQHFYNCLQFSSLIFPFHP